MRVCKMISSAQSQSDCSMWKLWNVKMRSSSPGSSGLHYQTLAIISKEAIPRHQPHEEDSEQRNFGFVSAKIKDDMVTYSCIHRTTWYHIRGGDKIHCIGSTSYGLNYFTAYISLGYSKACAFNECERYQDDSVPTLFSFCFSLLGFFEMKYNHKI